MIDTFAYVKARTIEAAIEHLAQPGSVLHAGGTDLLGCLRDRAMFANSIISISGLDELRGISTLPEGGTRIGALTTIDEIARDEALSSRYPALTQAALEVASPQLRNQGTLGGNLCQRPRCWYFRGDFHCLKKGGDLCYAVAGENQYHCILGGGPCYIVFPSDTAPALIAFNARVRISGPDGSRIVAMEHFFQLPGDDVEHENILKPGEILAEVLLPPATRNARSSYRKVRARRAWDFALASAAIVLRVEGRTVRAANIVLGGVAPVPWRAVAAEAVLVDRHLDRAAIRAAAEAAVEDARPLANNAYKVELVKGLLEEQLATL